jgi:hypothetical protein
MAVHAGSDSEPEFGPESRGADDAPGGRPDPRLRLFAQGCPGDMARPDARQIMLLSEISGPDESYPGATDDEMLGILGQWERAASYVEARKLAVVRELIRRHPVPVILDSGEHLTGGTRELPDSWDDNLEREISLQLGMSVAGARKLIYLAWSLEARVPRIGDALAGGLTPGKVKMIVDETDVLTDPGHLARAEEMILAGLPRCRTWMDLLRLVQGSVAAVDPEGARKRREKAEREHARVEFWRETSGACGLSGRELPPDEALAARAHIEARAQEYRAAGVKRYIDILRIAAFSDILNAIPAAERIAQFKAEDATRDAAARDGAAGDNGNETADKARDSRAGNAAPGEGKSGDGGQGADGGAGEQVPGGAGGAGDQLAGSPGRGNPGPANPGPGDGDGGGQVPAGGAGAQVPGGAGGADDHFRGNPGPGSPGPGDGDGGGQVPAGGAGAQVPGGAGGAGDHLRGSPGPGNGAPDGQGPGSPGGHRAGGLGGSAGAGPSVAARANLTLSALDIPLLTALGLAQRPGEARGLGALDPGLARELAEAAARDPRSQFCVTIVNDHGHAIAHGCCKLVRKERRDSQTSIPSLSRAGMAGVTGKGPPRTTGYPGAGTSGGFTFTPSGKPGPPGGFGQWILGLPRANHVSGGRIFTVDLHPVPTGECDHRYASPGHDPTGLLRHLIHVRDGTCGFPTCSRQARESDFEHAVPFEKGGRTCGCNGWACSRSCHRVKQSEGWTVTQPKPGWIQWTAPSGRVHTREPWRYRC